MRPCRRHQGEAGKCCVDILHGRDEGGGQVARATMRGGWRRGTKAWRCSKRNEQEEFSQVMWSGRLTSRRWRRKGEQEVRWLWQKKISGVHGRSFDRPQWEIRRRRTDEGMTWRGVEGEAMAARMERATSEGWDGHRKVAEDGRVVMGSWRGSGSGHLVRRCGSTADRGGRCLGEEGRWPMGS